jgi:WD40 repeat protein
MDVSLTGEYLIAGYAEGNLALFDISRQKLLMDITDVHYHEIENVKFLSIDSPITIVSGDKKGILYKITVTKTLLMYSFKTDLIMKKAFKEFCSLAALQPFKGMPKEVSEWHTYNIVAFSNTEELNVAVLGTNARKLYSVTRAEFAKGFVEQGNLCYLDWGYGITPVVSREKSKCLLAIGWGKVLQILILENPDKGMSGIRFDGYYICDYPID